MSKTDAIIQQIGKQPVIILPLAEYERLQEDLEMLRARQLPEKIAEARAEAKKGQVVSAAELKKRFITA